MGESVLTAAITGAIVGGIVFGLIYGVKYLIWKNQVPNLVSKFRWAIAIILGLLVVISEIKLGINSSSVGNLIIIAIVLGIVGALKRKETKK